MSQPMNAKRSRSSSRSPQSTSPSSKKKLRLKETVTIYNPHITHVTRKLYEGEVDKNGKYDGQGILYDIYGRIEYEGQFKDNEYNGLGKLFNHGKIVFDGHFKDGKYEGNGELFNDDKIVFKGHFNDGRYDGYGELFDRGLLRFKGFFKEGKKDGEGTLYDNSGQPTFIGHFENDKKDGMGTEYNYEGMKTFYGKFKNNKVVEEEQPEEIIRERFEVIGEYTFSEQNCSVHIVTKPKYFYLKLFSCIKDGESTRGKGVGRKLLLKTLLYIREKTNNSIQKIKLSAVPLDLSNKTTPEERKNALKKLIMYYEKLGFTQNSDENEGSLEGNIDNIISKIQGIKGGKKKKTRNYKKSNKGSTRKYKF